MDIDDLSDVFKDSEFRVFKQIVADGGIVRGFNVKGGNKYDEASSTCSSIRRSPRHDRSDWGAARASRR